MVHWLCYCSLAKLAYSERFGSENYGNYKRERKITALGLMAAKGEGLKIPHKVF
jgi:hypothetical protein